MKSHQVKFCHQEVERPHFSSFSVFFLLSFIDEAAFSLGSKLPLCIKHTSVSKNIKPDHNLGHRRG